MLQRVTVLTVLLAAMAATPLHGQQYKIIPRETLDSLANPVVMDSQMRFDTTKIDIGTTNEDAAPTECTFYWHNDGTEPIVVTEVRTGCGCAVAAYDRRPVTSGGSGGITITYHPKGHPGRLQRRITVFINGERRPAAVLELTGDVTPSVRPVHNYPCAMGSLLLKRTQVAIDGSRRSIEVIEVLNAGDKPLKLRADRRLLPEYLTVSCLPETIGAGERGDIEISFDPSKVQRDVPRQVPIIMEGMENLPPSRRTIYVNFEN